MRIKDSLISYFFGSLNFGIEAPKVYYYQTKSYIKRFILKDNSKGKVKAILVDDYPLWFRDDAFLPRELPTIYDNDYLKADPHLFKNLKTFMDIGANIGLISRCVRRHSPKCKCYIIEPLESNFTLAMQNNIDSTGANMGIGKVMDSKELLVDGSEWMASSTKFGYNQRTESFPIYPLDWYTELFEIRDIDLIKIDVEGMECEVIEGATNTLKHTKKVVAELHSTELRKDFTDLMRNHRFAVKKSIPVDKDVFIVLYEKVSK